MELPSSKTSKNEGVIGLSESTTGQLPVDRESKVRQLVRLTARSTVHSSYSEYQRYLPIETNGVCSVEPKSVAMISIVFKLLLALGSFPAFSSVSMVHGYPTGAGSCAASGGAIAAAGSQHKRATSETGALSKRGTTLAINGANVKGGESYTVGSTLKWTLKTTDTTYGMRGVLIRVAFTGGDKLHPRFQPAQRPCLVYRNWCIWFDAQKC
jgi:hypothetical protein